MTKTRDALLSAIEERVRGGESPGIVLGWLEAERPCIVAFGDRGQGGPALDEGTVFEIGSITKVFTATVLADMVVRGEVALDDPVATLLPAHVRVPTRNGRQVTLLDLATHTSALPRIPSNLAPYDPANPYVAYDVDRLYEFLSAHELTRDVGVRYEYSNLGAGLLGHALARRAKVSFERLVRERVLDPLGMVETVITLDEAMRARSAQGTDDSGNPVPPWDFDVLAGAGAFRSTARDMLRFLAAARDLHHGPLARAMSLSQSPRHALEDASNVHVGLGWHTLQLPDAAIVWHNGQTAGCHAFIGLCHANGGNAVVLSRSSRDIDDIGFHAIDARLPVRRPPPARTEIVLDAEVLDRWVGTYEIEASTALPAFRVIVTRRDAALLVEIPGKGTFELFAQSETSFFLKIVDAQVDFAHDVNGVVEGLVLRQGGAEFRGRRVE